MICGVELSKKVERLLRSTKFLPPQVVKKLALWRELIAKRGLEKVREYPCFHDEALKGNREGEYSIRLNKQWRAFYVIKNLEPVAEEELYETQKNIQTVYIKDINAHHY